MRLTVAFLLEDSENSESFIDFTTFSEFKAPENKVTINDLLEANPAIITEISKDLNITLNKEFDDENEVVLFVTDSQVNEMEEAMPLIQDVLDIFTENLIKLGFKKLSHVTIVHEGFPEADDINKFSRINSNLKVLN